MERINQLIMNMEDRLNMPSKSFGDIEPMEVRDYRHEAYRDWSDLLTEIRKIIPRDGPVFSAGETHTDINA